MEKKRKFQIDGTHALSKFNLITVFFVFVRKFNNFFGKLDYFGKFFLPFLVYACFFWFFKAHGRVNIVGTANNFNNLILLTILNLVFLTIWKGHKPRNPQGLFGM